ncbi:MAG: hypothetical protein AB8F34_10040 [Akkermansiaceae bacterium]
MSNHPYNNADSSIDKKSTGENPSTSHEEEPSKIVLEHAGEMDSEEYDAMLHEALAEREQMKSRRKKTVRLVMAACFLGISGSSYAWYASSPENQAKVHGLWSETVAMSQEVKDSADVGKIMEDYDAAMEQISVRQDQILDSAESIGADMTDDPESQARLDREMQKITGDAKTVGQRDAELRKKFGKFAESKRNEIEAERARKAAEGK